MIGKLFILFAATTLAWWLYDVIVIICRWFACRAVRTTLPAVAGRPETIVDALNDDTDDAHGDGPLDVSGVRQRRRYLRRVVLEARAHFPPMRRTQANTLVLDRWFRDTMREHGLRPSHIAVIKPLAVAAFFVRLDAEIAAAELTASSVVREAEDQYEEAWREPGWLWSLRRHTALRHTDV